jgi:hypothetical protein
VAQHHLTGQCYFPYQWQTAILSKSGMFCSLSPGGVYVNLVANATKKFLAVDMSGLVVSTPISAQLVYNASSIADATSWLLRQEQTCCVLRRYRVVETASETTSTRPVPYCLWAHRSA